jgi:predicted regulator of Ras-like GTPase activity (Roadblock/LC7/MglB family)
VLRVSDAAETLAGIRGLPGVQGAVVWHIGDAPIGDLGDPTDSTAPGLLSAGIGSMEQVVETVGLGQIEELWLMTDRVQCLAIRLGAWQAVVTAGHTTNIDGLRDAITDILEARA